MKRKARPPQHEYIRHLVYEKLPLGQVTKVGAAGVGWVGGWGAGRLTWGRVCEARRTPPPTPPLRPDDPPSPPSARPQVLKKLRRLPWADSEAYLLKALVRASHTGRFSQIPHIASLAAGLARYHPSLGVALVDEVLEQVEAGLEAPDAGAWVGVGDDWAHGCGRAWWPKWAVHPGAAAGRRRGPPTLPRPAPSAAGFYQRRVAAVRLLGELYNYKLLSSHVVFATLHLILAYGHEAGTPLDVTRWAGRVHHVAGEAQGTWLVAGLALGTTGVAARRPQCCGSPQLGPSCPRRRLDPPGNFFRIRLLCTLLGACGQYFTRGAARRKLDAFLPYLQRYLLAKAPLPLDVEFDVQVGGQMCGCGWVDACCTGGRPGALQADLPRRRCRLYLPFARPHLPSPPPSLRPGLVGPPEADPAAV